MPRTWYFGGVITVFIWGFVICLLARVMPGPRGFELAGTLLTLMPVGLDLLRKFYVSRNRPDTTGDEFSRWAIQRVHAAFLGYEQLYAWAVFLASVW